MREHGVLRRALLVYSEAATWLLAGGRALPLPELGCVATLFRRFGEDYHERSLEEQHVFPPLLKQGGSNAVLARTLTAQHRRGREITDYVSALVRRGSVAPAERATVATTLQLFVRMYAHHAAIEDTVIFPAWKQAISPQQYSELTEEFEELEHKTFGERGFEDAVKSVAAAEQAFGLGDLASLTAPPPPPATLT